MKINLEVCAIIAKNTSEYIIPTSHTGWSHIRSSKYKYIDFYEILGTHGLKKTSSFISSISGFNSKNILDGYLQQYLWWATKDSLVWEQTINNILPSIIEIKTSKIRELSLSLLKPVGLSSRANSLNRLIAESICPTQTSSKLNTHKQEYFSKISNFNAKCYGKVVIVFASTLTDIDYYGSLYNEQGYEVIFISLTSLPAWLSEYSNKYGRLIVFDDSTIYTNFEADYPMLLSVSKTYEYNQVYCNKFIEFLRKLNLPELLFNIVGNASKIALPDHPIIVLYPFLEYACENNIDIDIIPHNKTNYGFAWSNKETINTINLFCPLDNKYKYKSSNAIVPTNKYQYLSKTKKKNITKFAVIFAPALIAPRYNTYFSPLLLLKRIYIAILRYMQCGKSSSLIYYKPKNYYPHELDFLEMVELCKHLLDEAEYKLLSKIIPLKQNINSETIMQHKVDGIFIRDGSMIDVCLMSGSRAFHLIDDDSNFQLSENIGRDNIFRAHPDYHVL